MSGQWMLADPVPGEDSLRAASPKEWGEALERIVDFFRAASPEEWERLRLCPLQHGLETMAEMLKARR